MLYTNYCNYNFSNPDHDIINRPDGIPEYLFVYFQTSMRIRFDGVFSNIQPGGCILIPPYGATYYEAVKQFTNSFVHFSGAEVETLMTHYGNIPQNQVFYPPDVNSINRILKDVFAEYMTKDYLWEEQIDSLLRGLLVELSRQMGTSFHVPSDARELYDQFQKIRMTILTQPEKPWTVESMASLAHLGVSQFYSYYQDFFQRSPKSELLKVRLERAQYLLLHESFSVAVIGDYCGFSNLSHFTRYFKKHYGVAPGAYRKEALSR